MFAKSYISILVILQNAANIEKQCIANVRGQYKTLNAIEILLPFDVHKLEALTTTEILKHIDYVWSVQYIRDILNRKKNHTCPT